MTTTGAGPLATTLAWNSRTIGFDGAALSDVRAHPPLTARTAGSGSLSLAASGDRVGALVSDSNGCKFAPLDPTGADNGPATTLESGGCLSLAHVGDGFSFLVTTSDGASPASLTTIDSRGALRATTLLGVPANRAVWDRLVFEDGSFLLYTFYEDATSAGYTSWVQHFDARGAAMAAEVDVGANSAPVLLAPTKTSALAAWEPVGPGGPRIEIVALDRDGAATSPHRSLPSTGALYGLSLVPVPDGDVMLVWLEETGSASSDWKLSVRALAPDGVPRGPGTVVLEGVEAEPVQGVVEETGARAVLVFGGIGALPLDCVR